MDYAEAKRLTAARMEDPRPGDRFHEMASFWVEVVYRDGPWVVWWDSNSDLNRAGLVAEFRERFSLGSGPGYYVLYLDGRASLACVPFDRGERDRWFRGLLAERMERLVATSMASAML